MTPKREFVVAVFVVEGRRVLLLRHAKLKMWLPPGGHIDPGEIPDDAAVREVREETGLDVKLIGQKALMADVPGPRQLVIPAGIQLEQIEPGHEHIDLVYYAVPCSGTRLKSNDESTAMGWFTRDELQELDVTREIMAWCDKALTKMAEIRG